MFLLPFSSSSLSPILCSSLPSSRTQSSTTSHRGHVQPSSHRRFALVSNLWNPDHRCTQLPVPIPSYTNPRPTLFLFASGRVHLISPRPPFLRGAPFHQSPLLPHPHRISPLFMVNNLTKIENHEHEANKRNFFQGGAGHGS